MTGGSSSPHPPRSAALGTTLVVILVATSLLLGGGISDAATLTVDLGTAEDFSILAETAVTGDGTSQVDLSLGVSAGTATGFTPGQVGGSIHEGDAVALAAAVDLTAAYNDAFTRLPATTIPAVLDGQTLTDGVYRIPAAASLGGVLILDGLTEPNSVFIIQIVGALTTAAASSVSLINGAQACNVFWAVSAAVTMGAGASIAGNVMATGEITTGAGVNVDGRLLSVDAAVTAPDTRVTNEACLLVEPTTTTTATTTTATTTTTTTATTTTTIPTTTTTTTLAPTTTTTILEVSPTSIGTTTTTTETGIGAAAGSTTSGGLPLTGSDAKPALIVAVLALVAGVAMVRTGRVTKT